MVSKRREEAANCVVNRCDALPLRGPGGFLWCPTDFTLIFRVSGRRRH
jgi:hypothetical protein